jgi:hypothetical protein
MKCMFYVFFFVVCDGRKNIIQGVPKGALLKYLVVIIRRYQMCIEHAGQQFV